MKLTVYERLALISILPKEGDFVTLKLVRKLRETLSFSEKEIAQIDFQNMWKCPTCQKVEFTSVQPKCEDCNRYMVTAGQVTWDEKKATKLIKEVHLGDSMMALCSSVLKRLSDEEKLTEQQMTLYEKFCTGEEDNG